MSFKYIIYKYYNQLKEVELEKSRQLPKIDKNSFDSQIHDARVELENVSKISIS